jgi:hypothetical protein
MRILLSCQQALKPHAVPAYAFWEFYFKNALREAGHEIVEVPNADWAEGLTMLSTQERAAWLGSTWTRAVDTAMSEHRARPIDLFLSYLFPYQVEPSAVRTVRALGIPCVNFFCDNVREFRRVPASFNEFDLHWVPEADARALYAAARLPFIYAPMPMWVAPEYRNTPGEEIGDAIFIGSHDDLREDLLGAAVGLGMPLKVVGAGWNRSIAVEEAAPPSPLERIANQARILGTEGALGWAMRATYRYRKRRPTDWIDSHVLPPIYGDDYFKALRTSRVVIGVNRYPSFRHSFSNPHRYSRLRDIEAPMLGACLLTETAPGLADLYEIGTEIETFQGATELVEKSRRLLGDPAARLRLRQLGQRRALADHTIKRSIQRIVERLGQSK